MLRESAETSITVDDVTHVIDSGYMKEIRYNPATDLSTLSEVFISRANATQRSGRAGRVCPGKAWRCYSKSYLELPDIVRDAPLPEMMRIPLEEIILAILYLYLDNMDEIYRSYVSPSLYLPSIIISLFL